MSQLFHYCDIETAPSQDPVREKALLQAFVNVVDGGLAGLARHIAEEKWKASKPRMTWVDDPEFGPPHWKPADKRGMN